MVRFFARAAVRTFLDDSIVLRVVSEGTLRCDVRGPLTTGRSRRAPEPRLGWGVKAADSYVTYLLT